MERCIKISDARARLFDLVESVTGEAGGVVLLEHRDRAERAALVSERYLRYLQNTIGELRRHGSHPFRLAGSARLRAGGAGTLETLFGRRGAERGESRPMEEQVPDSTVTEEPGARRVQVAALSAATEQEGE